MQSILDLIRSLQILQVVGEWDPLRFNSAEEVILDGIRIVSK